MGKRQYRSCDIRSPPHQILKLQHFDLALGNTRLLPTPLISRVKHLQHQPDLLPLTHGHPVKPLPHDARRGLGGQTQRVVQLVVYRHYVGLESLVCLELHVLKPQDQHPWGFGLDQGLEDAYVGF